MASQMTDKTGGSLIEFLERAAEKGWINKNTAAGYRAACQRILEVESDWEGMDLSRIDVESLIQRFVKLKGGEYSPRSLETYRSRFQNAIQTYLEWADDPAAWRPPSSARRKRTEGASSSPSQSEETGRTHGNEQRLPKLSSGGSMITYPFPLREDIDAQLVLPRDLKAEEAKRLVAFINALSFEEPAR